MPDKHPLAAPAAAFRGTIGAVRTIPSRGVVTVTIEAKIEDHALLARICEHGSWVGVARIDVEKSEKEKITKEKRKWDEIPPASQAGILCTDPDFWEYIAKPNEEEAARYIYSRCGIKSRTELSTNPQANRLWQQIVIDYRIWQQARA